MAELILHHYDMSPFSEKIRLAFGHKGLDWQSVEVPPWMPKPDLMPLTGGYRKAPTLQIGADIYCDTLLIAREIDRRHPEPTLYPDGQVGLAHALSWWVEKNTFVAAAKLTTSIIGDDLPTEFVEERKHFMDEDFSKSASLRELPRNRQRLHAHQSWLADMLTDGRPFLLGSQPSVADLAAYHPLWFARSNGGGEAEAMLPLAGLRDWMDRIATLGHGRRHDKTAEAALDTARTASPEAISIPADADPTGLAPGERVVVRASDYGRDPVHGTLVAADAEEVIIRHDDDQVDTVHIHFPRAGFDVLGAQDAT